MSRILFLLVALTMTAQMANAREFAGVFGFNFTEKESTTTNASTDSEVGFQGGLQYYHHLKDFNEKLYFRTGGVFTQRISEAGVFEYKMLYLDIPATLEYRVSENVGLFSGLQLLMLMADSCSPNCSLAETETFVLGFPLGVSWMATPEMGFDFQYQIGLTDMWRNVEWTDTLSIQFLYKFDI